MAENQPLRVVLAQHDSESIGRRRRPYSWRVCVETGHDGRHVLATSFFIQGCAAKGYAVQMVEHTRYRISSTFRGSIEVGSIRAKDMQAFIQCMFTAVAYPRDDREAYMPQDWAEAALRRLNARGLLRALWTREYIEPALVSAERAWDRGDQ
ncbi:hypothetical protein C8Q73DRAFT_791156 [Cubamyces lactineus]|nr:hypothetical protein C8Q73DRAFT_791156 [Cubamyces lactineus]